MRAVALRGILLLSYESRMVEIDLTDLRLADVLDYIERRTGRKVNLIAGELGEK